MSESPRYELHCDHPAARARVAAWLDDMQLVWPGHFKISVQVGPSCPFPPDNREPLTEPTVEMRAGGRGDEPASVRIDWDLEPAAAVVHAELPHAEIWLTEEAIEVFELAERSFLLVVLVFLMRRLGWYHAHGAAITDPRGRGWLMVGNSKAGKSTTTAFLATKGWQISTDDIGFLSTADGKAVARGPRERIALRRGGQELLGVETKGIPHRLRNKRLYWAEELGGAWTPLVTPEIIVFPQFGERTAVTPATPRRALSELVKWSRWVLFEPQHAQEHLDVLGQLARQSQCYELTLGPDLFTRPERFEDLVP
jgi:hypothetical protein